MSNFERELEVRTLMARRLREIRIEQRHRYQMQHCEFRNNGQYRQSYGNHEIPFLFDANWQHSSSSNYPSRGLLHNVYGNATSLRPLMFRSNLYNNSSFIPQSLNGSISPFIQKNQDACPKGSQTMDDSARSPSHLETHKQNRKRCAPIQSPILHTKVLINPISQSKISAFRSPPIHKRRKMADDVFIELPSSPPRCPKEALEFKAPMIPDLRLPAVSSPTCRKNDGNYHITGVQRKPSPNSIVAIKKNKKSAGNDGDELDVATALCSMSETKDAQK
jgi:hypothetical protein